MRTSVVESDPDCRNFCVANVSGAEWRQIFQVGLGWGYTSHSVDLFVTSFRGVNNVLCCLCSAYTKRKEVQASLRMRTQPCYITVQTPHFMKRSVKLHYATSIFCFRGPVANNVTLYGYYTKHGLTCDNLCCGTDNRLI